MINAFHVLNVSNDSTESSGLHQGWEIYTKTMYRFAVTSLLQHYHQSKIIELISVLLRNHDKKEIHIDSTNDSIDS